MSIFNRPYARILTLAAAVAFPGISHSDDGLRKVTPIYKFDAPNGSPFHGAPARQHQPATMCDTKLVYPAGHPYQRASYTIDYKLCMMDGTTYDPFAPKAPMLI